MTTKPRPHPVRRKMCKEHRQYPLHNCPLCDQAIKAMVDRMVPKW